MQLTDIEKKFVETVARGEKFDSAEKDTEAVVIRAELIRDLYLNSVEISNNRLLLGSSNGVYVTESGVRLNGANIVGRLNLDGLGREAYYGLPGLHLTNCRFSEGISVCNAVIAEINLSHNLFQIPADSKCTLPPIHLTGTRILGSLNLTGIRGETDETPVWISARGVDINNGVFVRKARFFYQPKGSLEIDDYPNYAIDFSRSIIKGGINSTSGLICHGGLCILDAKIQGDIWLLGSHLIGGEKSALRGQGLRLDGNLIFRPVEDTDGSVYPAVCEGELELFGATATGGIYLSGLQIIDHPDNDRIGISKLSVNLCKATISSECSANLWVGDRDRKKAFSCSQKIEMSGAQIGGDINFNGATIGASPNEKHYLISLNASGVSIGGNLLLSSFNLAGQSYPLNLDGALMFDRANIKGSILSHGLTIKDEKSAWFIMKKALVLGELSIKDWKIAAGINFSESEIRGACTIFLQRPSMDGFSKPCSIQADLSMAKFGLSLWIYADVSQLNLYASVIEGLTVLDVSVTGDVRLMHAKFGSDLFFKNFRFQEPLEKKTESSSHLLQLKGATIDGNLKILLPQVEDVSDILITSAWSKELICYPGWTFLEVEVNRSNGIWYASFLKAPEDDKEHSGFYLCNSRSLIFHQLNKANQLNLSTEEAAKEYIKLFCACTWGDEDQGAFVITENAKHLPLDQIDKSESEKLTKFDPQEITPVESLPLETSILKSDDDSRHPAPNEVYLFKVFIRYSNVLFMSYLSLRQGGYIDMLDDTAVLSFIKNIAPEYKSPLRKQSEFFTRKSDFTSNFETEMEELSKNNLDSIKDSIERAIKDEMCSHDFSNAKVDLSEASVIGLDDNDGAGWGDDVQLNLINFRYQNYSTDTRFEIERESMRSQFLRLCKNFVANIVRYLAHRCLKLGLTSFAKRIMQSRLSVKLLKPKTEGLRSRIHQRMRWLELQFPKHPETLSKLSVRFWAKKVPYIRNQLSLRRFDVDLFESQPYSQAAAVFRKGGASEHARSIDYIQRKLAGCKYVRHAGWRRPLFWLLNWIFDLTSGYGLSPIRTLLVTIFFVVGGGLMTSVANHKGLLIVDALPVVQAAKDINGVPSELSYSIDPSGWRAGEVFCGETIEPILYATDIFIPLLDLRQEIRCMIRPANSPFDASLIIPVKAHYWWQPLVEAIAPVFSDDVEIWHWMRSIYSLAGWILISLLVYTLSHSLRAKDTIS